MLHKTEAIYIGQVPFGENGRVLRFFTEQHGMIPFLVPGVRSNKGSLKSGHLFPLNIIDIDYYDHQKNKLFKLKEAVPVKILGNIQQNRIKSLVSVFMAEILQKSLQEGVADSHLYAFIRETVLKLEDTKEVHPLFPCWFMLHYASAMGWAPHLEHIEGPAVFDPETGRLYSAYSASPLPQKLVPSEAARWLIPLDRSSAEQLSALAIKAEERDRLFRGLEDFFRFHLLSGRELRSPEIIRDVLH